MIQKTKFEKNAFRIAAVIASAFERAKQTYPPESRDFERVSSFYADEKLNLNVNWFNFSQLQKLNAILVNTDEVNLSDITTVEQEARTQYKIFICAQKDDDTHEAAQTVTTAARIMREKLTAAPLSFFDCVNKKVSQIIFDPAKMPQGLENFFSAVMLFTAATREPLTDIDGNPDAAKINETTISADGGIYKMFLEWE